MATLYTSLKLKYRLGAVLVGEAQALYDRNKVPRSHIRGSQATTNSPYRTSLVIRGQQQQTRPDGQPIWLYHDKSSNSIKVPHSAGTSEITRSTNEVSRNPDIQEDVMATDAEEGNISTKLIEYMCQMN